MTLEPSALVAITSSSSRSHPSRSAITVVCIALTATCAAFASRSPRSRRACCRGALRHATTFAASALPDTGVPSP